MPEAQAHRHHPNSKTPWRFSIRWLLALTVVCAVILTSMRFGALVIFAAVVCSGGVLGALSVEPQGWRRVIFGGLGAAICGLAADVALALEWTPDPPWWFGQRFEHLASFTTRCFLVTGSEFLIGCLIGLASSLGSSKLESTDGPLDC